RLRAQRRVLHASHGGSVSGRTRGAESGCGRRPRSDGLHDDASYPDAHGGGTDSARSRADRVDGPASVERHLRGDRPRAAASPGADRDTPAGRDDIQSQRPPRRRGLRRAARQPSHEPAAARYDRRQDSAHHPGPARADEDEHGQRERPLSDPGSAPTLFAFNIGLATWETVDIVHKGANYGYSLREGTQSMSPTNGMGP